MGLPTYLKRVRRPRPPGRISGEQGLQQPRGRRVRASRDAAQSDTTVAAAAARWGPRDGERAGGMVREVHVEQYGPQAVHVRSERGRGPGFHLRFKGD